MRSAISAVAAASGLLLLGLAFYGQPAVYLHQAREQWNALIQTPPADEPSDQDRAAVQRAAQLQQQVAQLERELAARQATASAQQAKPVPPQPLQLSETQPATPKSVIAPEPKGLQVKEPQAAPPAAAPPQVATRVASPPPPEPSAPKPTTLQIALPQPAVPHNDTPPVQVPQPEQADATQAAGSMAPAVAVPERHEAVMAEVVSPSSHQNLAPTEFGPPRPEPVKSEPARPEPARAAEQAKPVLTKSEAARTERLASSKAVPAPPPLPQPPPRQDTEDARSVLARLRQLAPGPAPAQQADIPPPVEQRPRPIFSPLVPGLSTARGALLNGRVDDARRLLQQTQLQLVFGPMGSQAGDSPVAGRGAADVAHALDALSANDVPLSRRYIEIAIADLSGTGTNVPVQEFQARPTGYAPAYPPR